MNLKKIVLTGGPCAGKTTALKNIKEYLQSKNILVITVPESATELILNGINPWSVPVYNFQDLVLEKQYSKETIAESYAKIFAKDEETCVIIYDRGIIDNKAYLENNDDFTKLLKNANLNEIDILDSYDIVLDLLSTATCKKEVYNLLNEARMEDVNTAVEVDRRTTKAWIHHRNLNIIPSTISLEEETKLILEIIDNFLNNKQTKKINKYLLDNNSDISIYNESNSEKVDITSYTLDYNNYKYVLTKRKYKDNISYIYEVYTSYNNFKTYIENKKITKEEFYELLCTNTIKQKEDYEEINFLYNNLKYRICIFDNYKTLEVENLLNNKLQIPENLSIIEGKKEEESLPKNRARIRRKNGNL